MQIWMTNSQRFQKLSEYSMCIFWASENAREGFIYEAVAQNTDNVREGITAKWNNDLVLHDILISLFYLLHPNFFLWLWI